jgi:hypothetical protein
VAAGGAMILDTCALLWLAETRLEFVEESFVASEIMRRRREGNVKQSHRGYLKDKTNAVERN